MKPTQLLLEFETIQDRELFEVLYLNQLEQDTNYIVNHDKSSTQFFFLEGDPDRCPKCSSLKRIDQYNPLDAPAMSILGLKPKKGYKYVCEDCGHPYNLKK